MKDVGTADKPQAVYPGQSQKAMLAGRKLCCSCEVTSLHPVRSEIDLFPKTHMGEAQWMNLQQLSVSVCSKRQ